jgi:hypothetical protein
MTDKPKSKRRNMKSFKLEEISVVDKPAQEGAKMAIMKRKDDPLGTKLIKYYLKHGTFANTAMVHIAKSAGGKTATAVWPGLNAFETSLRSIIRDNSLDDVNKVKVMKSEVNDFLTFTKQRVPEIEAHLLKAVSSTEDDGMNLRQLQKQMGELTQKLNAVVAVVEKSAKANKAGEDEATAKRLSSALAKDGLEKDGLEKDDVEKDGMEDELPAFMQPTQKEVSGEEFYEEDDEDGETEKVSEDPENEKPTSEGEQEEMIAGGSPRPIGGKRASKRVNKRERFDDDEDDAVIKVATEAGVRTIRKSAIGADMFEVIKAQAETVDRLAKSVEDERDLREIMEFTKVAEDELSHLPGSAEEKALVLKRLSSVLDKKDRVVLSRMLKAGDAGISAAFETVGVKTEKVAAAGTFQKRVNEIRARDNCSHTVAMQKARREHPDEFVAYQGH